MTDATACVYMQAAYQTLGADACGFGHRHEPRVFSLARALAVAFQPEPTTDERIAWFLNDADAIVDDFPDVTDAWIVDDLEIEYDEDLDEPVLPGIDKQFKVNGVEYVVQASDLGPATPVKRMTYESWLEREDA